jgi:hypothetical protein
LVAGPSVDIYIDSVAPAAIPFISYGEASEIISLAPGKHHLTITLAGTPLANAVFDTSVTIAADSLYTTFVLGSVFTQAFDVITMVDPLTVTIPADSARVRIMNASTQVGPLTVKATPDGGTPFTESNIAYRSATPYHSIKPGTLTLLLSQGTDAPFLKVRGYPTGTYAMTILVAGDYDPNDLNNFFVYALIDNDTNKQTPIIQFSRLALAQGGFRSIHVASGFDFLDVFRDNLSTDSMPMGYRFASRQRIDLLDQHNFKVARQGSGLANALVDINLDIRPDTTTNLFLLGTGTTLKTKVLITPKSVVADPVRTPIRFLHASPDVGTVDIGITLSDATREQVSGMKFEDATQFFSFVNGAASFNVYRTGETVPLAMYSGEIPPEVVVTAILNGSYADTTLSINLFIETNESEQEPMVYLAGIASVEGELTVVATTTIAPNPIRETGRISFNLERASRCILAIYDNSGRLVRTVADEDFARGRVEIPFSTEGISSGNYSVVASRSNGQVIARGKVVVVR